MIHAVIMAGGSGTRFWPLSRQAHPKQCLALGTDLPLIVETSRRLTPLIPVHQHRIVAGKSLSTQITKLFPSWSTKQILWEPCARNTAPCIGLAALTIDHLDPDAILVVLPSDHHIADETAFLEAISMAADCAQKGDLVTIGIRPNRPETGYGYIQIEEELSEARTSLSVKRFVEKPSLDVAKQYLAGGKHLWNSGIFVFSARRMLSDLEKYQPQLFSGLMRLRPFLETDEFDTALHEIFPRLPAISVDYGILEPCSADPNGLPITVVPSSFGWNDVGSWEALEDYAALDENGNAIGGRIIQIDTTQSILQANGPAVAVIGLDSIVVVSTPDAVLVCRREDAQRVKEIPELAKKLGWEDLC